MVIFVIVFTIDYMRSLSRLLYWEEGFLIWLSSRYILFRFLCEDVCVGSGYFGMLYCEE